MRALSERLRICLLRPFQLLYREIIAFFVSVYKSVLQGLLYMIFLGRVSMMRAHVCRWEDGAASVLAWFQERQSNVSYALRCTLLHVPFVFS